MPDPPPQSEKPPAQPRTQEPVAQVAVSPAPGMHVVPHAPQFSSVLNESQIPSDGAQLSYPVSQLLAMHCPGPAQNATP